VPTSIRNDCARQERTFDFQKERVLIGSVRDNPGKSGLSDKELDSTQENFQ